MWLKQELTKSGSNYLKLKEGDNKIRIVSDAIQGFEGWQDNKPVRRTLDNPFTGEERKVLDCNENGKPKLREFVACTVWNYDEGKIQVMSLTQASIIRAISEYSADSDFGNPTEYDLKISRKGVGLETEYTVKALPPRPLVPDVQAVVNETKVNLDALFENGDPFAS